MVERQINVFIASPTDLVPERRVVKKVCSLLDKAVGDDIKINSISWEDYPQHYTQDAQTNINTHLSPSECDIVIVMFWRRLGTYLPNEYRGAITGDVPVTGTQWEFEEALASGKPSIHFYLKDSDRDSIEGVSAQKQIKLLDDFLKKIGVYRGSTEHGFHEFSGAEELEQRLVKHLSVEIESITGRKISVKIPADVKNTGINRLIYILAVVVVAAGWFLVYYDSIQHYLFPGQKADINKSKTLSPDSQNGSDIASRTISVKQKQTFRTALRGS